MKSGFLFILRYIVVAASVAAAIYAVILALAEYDYERDTATSVPAAVHLVPYNATYLARLASWQSEERETLLRRAVRLNPFDYDSLIRLGLMAEMQRGDAVTAEKDYLNAAGVNHMFLPKWTLTNFYFRQEKPAEFFAWARRTLEVTPYSSDPVFAQMWLMSQDPAKLNEAIPDRPRILLQYAWYLSNIKQFAAIPDVVERLVRAVGKGEPRDWGRDDLIAVSEDHMLMAGDVKDALKVWSGLRQGGWIMQAVPDEQHPLTNGDFRIPLFRHGFDWMPIDANGVRIDHFPEDATLRISLSGDQLERCVLLQQYVTVAPDRDYSMHWQVNGQDVSEVSGLAWHLRPVQASNSSEISSGDLLASNRSWDFHSPPGAQVFLLTLEYNRPLGSVRAHGTVILQSVTINQK